ncbi:hypothetical protein GCM10028773_43530 [Spirosoma koreense]
MMVEVFKTNVQNMDVSKRLIQILFEHIQADRISFDLEDCDRVLRVEGPRIIPALIIDLVNRLGYQCELLL